MPLRQCHRSLPKQVTFPLHRMCRSASDECAAIKNIECRITSILFRFGRIQVMQTATSAARARPLIGGCRSEVRRAVQGERPGAGTNNARWSLQEHDNARRGLLMLNPRTGGCGGQRIRPPCVAALRRNRQRERTGGIPPNPFTLFLHGNRFRRAEPALAASASRSGKSGAKTHRPKLIASVTSKGGIERNPPQAAGGRIANSNLPSHFDDIILGHEMLLLR